MIWDWKKYLNRLVSLYNLFSFLFLSYHIKVESQIKYALQEQPHLAITLDIPGLTVVIPENAAELTCPTLVLNTGSITILLLLFLFLFLCNRLIFNYHRSSSINK